MNNEMAQIDICVPSLSEQTSIACFLNKKCFAIDKLIGKKQSLVEKLTEYKKSLIYEVVTGKIDI
jgi:type I restriction enzyme S subunit